jgi:hypothetical protein
MNADIKLWFFNKSLFVSHNYVDIVIFFCIELLAISIIINKYIFGYLYCCLSWGIEIGFPILCIKKWDGMRVE